MHKPPFIRGLLDEDAEGSTGHPQAAGRETLFLKLGS